MRLNIAGFLATVSERMIPPAETGEPLGNRRSITELVEEARQEWQAARAYFETVSEPELVDHAIYLVEAAEKKYMYLLKKAREEMQS